jgi:hypothetical protein
MGATEPWCGADPDGSNQKLGGAHGRRIVVLTGASGGIGE